MALEVKKTYGKIYRGQVPIQKSGNIYFDTDYKPEMKNAWIIESIEPHVSIKLKNIFTHIPRSSIAPYHFDDTAQNCMELLWFMDRYPLQISEKDSARMAKGRRERIQTINKFEQLLLPDYVPEQAQLNEGETARDYQLKAKEIFLNCANRLLLGDDLGLGKTLTAILSFLPIQNRPVAVVCQAHLPRHWEQQIKRFTNLSVHIVKTRSAYSLPNADVYIYKYTSLSGWVELFQSGFFKLVTFDEVQELRHTGTDKYNSAKVLSEHAGYVLGMSATPVYNYGNEIYNVLNLINPLCLGHPYDFSREWGDKVVSNPEALGTYLRESLLFLRRTRAEVGRELPPVNKIVYTVDHDEDAMEKDMALAKTLALKIFTGSFHERGEAARELDALVRHATGVSKAKSVAAYVKILLESGEPLVIAAWHRDVYTILLEELKDYNPVMYTGSESISQKEKAKEDFISGKSKVFIISLRSGIGLDGLQHVCKYVVFAELDWSPAVMNQVIGRVDRDGQEDQVTAMYLVSESGSDPVLVDILALKASQQHGINDPMLAVPQQYSDESRIKLLAAKFIDKEYLKKSEHENSTEQELCHSPA